MRLEGIIPTALIWILIYLHFKNYCKIPSCGNQKEKGSE